MNLRLSKQEVGMSAPAAPSFRVSKLHLLAPFILWLHDGTVLINIQARRSEKYKNEVIMGF